MRFITFKKDNKVSVGLEIKDKGIIDLKKLDPEIPNSLNEIIKNFSKLENDLKKFNNLENIHYFRAYSIPTLSAKRWYWHQFQIISCHEI